MATEQATLQTSLAKGLAYLAKVQRPDGGFDSYSSPLQAPFRKTVTYQTTFVPAVMLAALSKLQTPGSRHITKCLADFVKAQRSPGWSFNYWAAASPERRNRPYPDDLDDTACALIGLFRYESGLVGPEVLAAFIKLLLATETQVGGPYRTWLVPAGNNSAWSDTDLAVNANIAYFLSLASRPLPNLTGLMEQAIRNKQLSSPYYASTVPVVYYLARAYRGPLTGALRKIAGSLHGAKSLALNPLQAALLLSAVLELKGAGAAKLAAQLVAAQQPDGAWPADAFCLDPARGKTIYYHGGESLTTALVLEALEAYRLAGAATVPALTPFKQASGPAHNRRSTALQARVSVLNRRQWRQLRPELHHDALDFTTSLAKTSGSAGIVTLAEAFNESLERPLAKAQEPMLAQLGLANLYGWAAYTIYDDFLDDEGRPGLLPIASSALRYCLEAFDNALPEDQVFKDLVRQTFDKIDGANAWELAHCRFERRGQQLVIAALPDYGDPAGLAERSLGHTLTPLAVLRAKGVEPDSQLFNGVRQALVHYLAARQLNDDAHDWQTDLRNGHITYVVARLLADAGIKPGRYAWDTLLPPVQKQFWHGTLPKICRDISRQTALSRCSLDRLPGLKRRNALTKLLDGIDASVSETLDTQSRTQSFLQYYKHGLPAA
jgi:hypothetical protein